MDTLFFFSGCLPPHTFEAVQIVTQTARSVLISPPVQLASPGSGSSSYYTSTQPKDTVPCTTLRRDNSRLETALSIKLYASVSISDHLLLILKMDKTYLLFRRIFDDLRCH